MCNVPRVRGCLLPVVSHVALVMCHLSLTPTATATDPAPANSQTMHSRLVQDDQKTQKLS